MNTAATATTPPAPTAVLGHAPVYIAPAAHQFLLAPAGHVYLGPTQKSSGIGIHADHHT